MKNRVFLKRKAIIASLIVSFLICSVSTTNVVIQGSMFNNIIDKEKKNYNYDYNEIINSLKEQLSNTNYKFLLYLLNEIDNDIKNHFGDKFFEDFPFFYNQTIKFIGYTDLANLEMLQILYKKIMPIHREIINIISGKEPVEEISPILMDALETFYFNSNKKPTDSDSVLMKSIDDPYGYWENYSKALDCWRLLVNDARCFQDWIDQFVWVLLFGSNGKAFKGPLALINYAFIIAALIATQSSLSSSGFIAWAVVTVILTIDFILLTHFIVGWTWWAKVDWREVKIILHIVDKAKGENITGLEGKCYLTSIDANNWPLETYSLSVENDFNYTLEKALYSNKSINSGWYSLVRKSLNDYLYPPPPPGRWKIIIPEQIGYYGRFETETSDIPPEDSYIDTIKLNNAPKIPSIISDDHFLKINEIGKYCAHSTDPSNDRIKYCFDWDDNSGITCTYLTNSGNISCLTHSWNKIGNYSVQVMTEDEFGAKSTWSSPFWVNVTE